ncbi:putative cytochrome P450 pisatin demethylase [Trematosphaeria pertusa]|uniref:Putative cytochrome P450 pisatin demethylase n=1 Tax=Trematosphaeria pertusa TaxID=390896 RepID=A0A6A6HS63_9PLEO|nr:putative cytochrome P450 pisatin demethylase [Trematosphaeria pertusa]KAF2240729.1 putative cytochrome P450 pisatin demethylase [Trematosphaeria pertusa]
MHLEIHTAVVLLPFALLILRLLTALYNALVSPLRGIPGPFSARFTKLWYFHRVLRGSFHHDNIALHQCYGPIVRIAPNLYSISTADPKTIQTVYGIGSKFPKSDWYDGWANPKSDKYSLFPDRHIRRHAEARKRFQRMYSMSEMVNYEGFVNACARIFDQRLREFTSTRDGVDMAHWFQCYAFDVIGDVTYSARFGFLDDGKDKSDLLTALHRTQVYSTLIGIYAEWHRAVWDLAVRIPWTGASARGYLMQYVSEQIERRQRERRKKDAVEEGKKEDNEGMPKDFLDKLMDGHDEDPDKVTAYHIFMMGLSNIIAGSDTTAVTLSAIFYYLLRNPPTLATLRAEIADFDRRGECSHPDLSFKESQAMPYLQAVIKEALRLHPATGLPMWRVVPEGGAELCGQYMPGGTVVGLNCWVAHYDKQVFGPDVKEFRPERWIEAENDAARLKEMNAAWIPFGMGSRTCLGRHVSMLEMSKLVPRLVRDYDFELEGDEKEWDTANFWFVKPVDFRVTVKARKEDS